MTTSTVSQQATLSHRRPLPGFSGPIAAFLGVFTALNIILIVADAPTGMRLIPTGLVLAAALGAFIAVLLRRARHH